MQPLRNLALPFLLVLLAFPTARVSAQKSYAIGITAGAAIPTGNFSDGYSKGMAVTGILAVGVADLPIGLRFDGMYHAFPGRTVTPAGGGADILTPDLRLWGLSGNLVITTAGTSAKPYLLGGVGFYNSKVDSAEANSRNNLGFSGGVGSTFNVGPFASVLEVRYHAISRKPEDGGNIHFVPVLLGIMF